MKIGRKAALDGKGGDIIRLDGKGGDIISEHKSLSRLHGMKPVPAHFIKKPEYTYPASHFASKRGDPSDFTWKFQEIPTKSISKEPEELGPTFSFEEWPSRKDIEELESELPDKKTTEQLEPCFPSKSPTTDPESFELPDKPSTRDYDYPEPRFDPDERKIIGLIKSQKK